MSSTVKFYASLRTCYYGSPLLRRTWICAPPPFFSLDARRQGRTFYSSHRIAFNPPLLHKWNSAFSRGIFTAILFTGAAASYTIIASKPLKLESVEPSGEYLGEEEITQRYSPPIPPVTMAQANEALRWEESYNAVGEGSGVLRFDTVRVPSNSPPEDELISASGYEDDELKWLMWGVFDGHA